MRAAMSCLIGQPLAQRLQDISVTHACWASFPEGLSRILCYLGRRCPQLWASHVERRCARPAKAKMRTKTRVLDAYQPHKAGGRGNM
jgi:hypothetical protein